MIHKIILASALIVGFGIEASAQSITESDAVSILDNYGSSFNALAINTCLQRNKQPYTGTALEEAFTVKQNEVIQLLNRGDKIMAAAKASTMLDAFGHCYSKSTSQGDRTTYARFMGGFIATDGLAYKNNTKIQNAITLLDYAKSHNQPNSQFAALVEPYRIKSDVKSEASSETIKVNFYEVGEVYKSNKLRLKKKYGGKKLVGEAKVWRIGDYDSGAIFINLDGPKTIDKSSGEVWDSWMVTCNIKKGSPSEDKAIDLNKGDSFRITGTLEIGQKSYSSPMLKECEILG